MRMSNLHEKMELKKGPWTREEDQKLFSYIEQHGHGCWRSLPEKAGLERCGKSCRLRWTNYLRPDIKRGKFTTHEDKTIIRLHALLGNRWSAIATHMPKRTDNEIKNYWNTRLKKRLTRMGIDPVTHKPKNVAPTNSKQVANLNHLTQWETVRLEAEVRLVRQSKFLRCLDPTAVPPPPPRCLDVLKVWESTTNKNGFFDLTKKTIDQNSPIIITTSSSTTTKDNYVYYSSMNNDNDVVFDNNNNSGACGVMEEEVKGIMETQHQPQDNNNIMENMSLDCDFNYIWRGMDLIRGDYNNSYDTNMVWDVEDRTQHWDEFINQAMMSASVPM